MMETRQEAARIRTPVDLGLAVRRQRKANGLTLAEVAGLTNVGVRFLSELENGKPTIQLDKLLRVLNGMGLLLHLTSPLDARQET